jgi:hypothetical protein
VLWFKLGGRWWERRRIFQGRSEARIEGENAVSDVVFGSQTHLTLAALEILKGVMLK